MHTVSKRKFDFRAFAFFEILTLGAGLLSGFVSGTAGFERLIKPPLTPPAFVFPLVWTVLYALRAFAAYLSSTATISIEARPCGCICCNYW